MFDALIQRKFPQDERLGMYVKPNLPASKLGKILIGERGVKQPGDVSALYLNEGFFSSSYFILTADSCYFSGGSFRLEELREAKADGAHVVMMVNVLGGLSERRYKAKDDEAARVLATVMSAVAYYDPEKENAPEENPAEKYKQFEGQALDWLLLRDEVMKTIDLLYEKFNDGKLSLIEYEEKKEQLLARL